MTLFSIKFVYGRKDSHTHTHGLLFCTLFSFYEENLYMVWVTVMVNLKEHYFVCKYCVFVTKCELKESVGLLHCIFDIWET